MRASALTIALGVAAGGLFVLFPEIDLAASRLFYVSGSGFVLLNNPFSVVWQDVTHGLAKAVIVILAAGLVFTLLARRPVLGLDSRRFLFLLLCFGIGSGLIAGAIFKENWGRARPAQVTEFAGTKQFTPAFVISCRGTGIRPGRRCDANVDRQPFFERCDLCRCFQHPDRVPARAGHVEARAATGLTAFRLIPGVFDATKPRASGAIFSPRALSCSVDITHPLAGRSRLASLDPVNPGCHR
jgi:hypothetical protein